MSDTRTPKITRDGKTWYASLPADDGLPVDVRRGRCIGRPVGDTTCLVRVRSLLSA